MDKRPPTEAALDFMEELRRMAFMTVGRAERARHFPAFIEDCDYILGRIDALTAIVEQGLKTFPPEFEVKVRKNRATLAKHSKPPQGNPKRPPSVPKLSPEQKRAKAEKDARLAKKKA
jgi:hypothetical protein